MNNGQRAYKTFELTIAAGGRIKNSVAGSFIRCLEATGGFELSLDDGSGAYFAAGLGYEMPPGEQFQSFAITNKNGAPITVVMGIGAGRMQDSRFSAVDGVEVAAGGSLAETPDISLSSASAAEIIAISGQKEIIIQAVGTNSGALRVGSSADTSKGAELAAGGSMVLEVACNIWIKNPTAAAQKFNVLQVGS